MNDDIGRETTIGREDTSFDGDKQQQAPKKRTWFRQKPYVYATAGFLLIYSLIASQNREMLAWVDIFLSPLVDNLHLIGLGITKPFMDGPMPERFYTNLVGIGVYGVLAYNLRSIFWYVKMGVQTSDKQAIRQRIRDKWGLPGLWLAIAASYFFGVLFAIYLVLTFLNGIHGWLVFHVHDFIVPPIAIMMWVYPGALITALCWPIIWIGGNALDM